LEQGRKDSSCSNLMSSSVYGQTQINNDVETILLDIIRENKIEALQELPKDAACTNQLLKNWDIVKKCAQTFMENHKASDEYKLFKTLLDLLTNAQSPAEPEAKVKVGEMFLIEGLAACNVDFVISTLQYWSEKKGFSSTLDIIHTVVYYASNRRVGKDSESLALVEMAIYCATIEQKNKILEAVLKWHDDHIDIIGASVKLNADCIIHAALEDDKERLKLLYRHGYRLGPDTDRRINKDYLKRIKLFRARASPIYSIAAFEESKDIHTNDPLKTSFEYAKEARSLAGKFQDFNTEYLNISGKCEDFSKELLDKCTTKHEVQTLLQTKSYPGHTDANFNIAILDGHKEFVAHEKFQQMLHKKWGQRDRMQWKNSPSEYKYNIFWSEMSTPTKLAHIVKQMFIFLILPLVVLATTFNRCLYAKWPMDACFPCSYFIRESQIPVNRFLYWELSKWIFYAIVMITLVDMEDYTWFDLITVFWIISYLLENIRTVHRLYRFSEDVSRIFKRWLTFRNLYILFTDVVFLVAFILRGVAYYNGQCRYQCPYEGNEIAFVAGAVWSFAALLAFLRAIQIGLMWRQTGPIIISMSYMILDVVVFLFIFVIVYVAFTLSIVQVYNVYSSERTGHFNTHKSAFKLFFWAMIRTGNPQFADIRVFNATKSFDKECLSSTLTTHESIGKEEIENCAFEGLEDNEEGIPYVMGNTLWAFYQFSVLIVLLSVLRARMVNTYHRIFKEADVQWKFFRASIWWKYLDGESVLPPPFTVFYLVHKLAESTYRKIAETITTKTEAHANSDVESPKLRRKKELEISCAQDKDLFEKRYTHLMLTLTMDMDKSSS